MQRRSCCCCSNPWFLWYQNLLWFKKLEIIISPSQIDLQNYIFEIRSSRASLLEECSSNSWSPNHHVPPSFPWFVSNVAHLSLRLNFQFLLRAESYRCHLCFSIFPLHCRDHTALECFLAAQTLRFSKRHWFFSSCIPLRAKSSAALSSCARRNFGHFAVRKIPAFFQTWGAFGNHSAIKMALLKGIKPLTSSSLCLLVSCGSYCLGSWRLFYSENDGPLIVKD